MGEREGGRRRKGEGEGVGRGVGREGGREGGQERRRNGEKGRRRRLGRYNQDCKHGNGTVLVHSPTKFLQLVFFLQLSGQPRTTVLCFIPPRPAVCILTGEGGREGGREGGGR